MTTARLRGLAPMVALLAACWHPPAPCAATTKMRKEPAPTAQKWSDHRIHLPGDREPNMPPGQFGTVVDPRGFNRWPAIPIHQPAPRQDHAPGRPLEKGPPTTATIRRRIAALEDDLKALESSAEIKHYALKGVARSSVALLVGRPIAPTAPTPCEDRLLLAIQAGISKSADTAGERTGAAYDTLRLEIQKTMEDLRDATRVPGKKAGRHGDRVSAPTPAFHAREIANLTRLEMRRRASTVAGLFPRLPAAIEGARTPPVREAELPVDFSSANEGDAPPGPARELEMTLPEPVELPGQPLGLDRGQTVKCPQPGLVAYVGRLRGWGNCVLVQQDFRRSFIVTGLATLSVREGEFVRTGTPLGKSDGSSRVAAYIGAEETQLPR